MKLRKLALAPIAAAFMALAVTSANAAPASTSLTVKDPTANLGTGPWGTVTLTQFGLNEVDVNVTLAAGTSFVDTGSHTAFVFNVDKTVAVSGVPTGWSAGPAPATNSIFGQFTNGVTCGVCGNGATNPQPGPLTFAVTATGITLADFVKNGSGYFFSADVYSNGFTGPVGAVPEPETYAMLLAGLGLMGFMARRRKQQEA